MGGRGTQGIPGSNAATIPNGAAVSNPIALGGTKITAILLPAAWTAADLSFEASVDGAAWAAVWDDANAEVLIAAATVAARLGQWLVPTPGIMQELAGLHFVRLRSGNTAANVNQAAARSFTILTKS